MYGVVMDVAILRDRVSRPSPLAPIPCARGSAAHDGPGITREEVSFMVRYAKLLAPAVLAVLLLGGAAWTVQAAGEAEACCCCPECPDCP